MFDVLMSADWLQNHTKTIKTLNAFENRNVISYNLRIFKRIFSGSLKSAEYSASLHMSKKKQYFMENKECMLLRPGSYAVLHMSRIEFNELSSCEVRRMNQFDSAD